MGLIEQGIDRGFGDEHLDPRHYYAAYVFDGAERREHDVTTLVEEARRLGYPVRYWWLSDALDLQGEPDRLIVCVHHPSGDENAGMDLYDTLTDKRVTWDDLEAAAFEEYRAFSQPLRGPGAIYKPDGVALFPPPVLSNDAPHSPQSRPDEVEAFFAALMGELQIVAHQKLGREFTETEMKLALIYLAFGEPRPATQANSPPVEEMDDVPQPLFRDDDEDASESHPLLDAETRARLPKLYSGEQKGLEALVGAKFFTPDGHWTWYASEFDGGDTFFGLVIGQEIELRHFSLAELEELRGPLGLPIERDLHFEPQTLQTLKTHHERERRSE
jgi:hypothetical protein